MALNQKRKHSGPEGSRKAQKLGDGGLEHSDNEEEETASDQGYESGEWDGIGMDVDGTLGQLERSGKAPTKPPTGEELRTIKDAAELYRSNTFKLQIDALLPKVRPKTKRIEPVERFLHSLHSILLALPSVKPQHPLEASKRLLKKGVAVPYPLPVPTEDTNWKVAFEKPSEIAVVGSWINKTCVKGRDGSRFGIDLALEMPKELFQEKDYLNSRFFHKRAFYLATIAAALQDPKTAEFLDVELSYRSLGDDPRLTKLVLSSKDGATNGLHKLNAEICLLPVLPDDAAIPLSRLSPSHANIRICTMKGVDGEGDSHESSPIYNAALLTSRASLVKHHMLSVHALKQGCPAFTDALTLLRVWANQRGYDDTGTSLCVRGFSSKGCLWTSILEYLLNGEEPLEGEPNVRRKDRQKLIGRGVSSYQLFRAALDLLGKTDFVSKPLFVKSPDGHRYPPELYEQYGKPALVDSSSSVNLLSGVPLGSLRLLRDDALRTLAVLDGFGLDDPFIETFMRTGTSLSTRYDAVICADLSGANPIHSSAHEVLDAGSAANATLASAATLLSAALGNRVQSIVILHPSPSHRPLSQAHPSSPHIIHVGLVYNTQHAFRQVDHGPPATETDSAASERFKALWGEKSELRRFKDGNITESVVWEVSTADDKAHIPCMIVRWILHWHFRIPESAVSSWQEPFDSLVKLPPEHSKMYIQSGISVGFKGALAAYDNLVRQIKGLDLPLSLLNVSAVSESLRYTSVFAPVPVPQHVAAILPSNARYLQPIDVVLEFEKSSKWPDDLRAIQKMKLAFFERIASALMVAVDNLKAVISVGECAERSDIQDQSWLEVLTPEGWAFNVRIWHEREAVLLDRVISNKVNRLPHVVPGRQNMIKDGEYHAALEAKQVYLLRYIHGPRHHRAIARLSHHYPAFVGTTRLVKRWVSSHWLLGGHVTEEVIELLCSNLFVHEGWEQALEAEQEQSGSLLARAVIPGSKERGFSLMMRWLMNWKWEEGIFVPLYSSVTADSALPKAVSGLTTGVWKVSTSLDSDGHVWTRQGPDAVCARRISALAAETWAELSRMEDGQLSVQRAFSHSPDDYHFVLSLDPGAVPRYFQSVRVDVAHLSSRRRGKYSNLEEVVAVRPGFDPAYDFYLDLQRVYKDTCKLFYDPFGGVSIGGIWDPTIEQAKPFRVMGGYSSMPIEESTNGKAKPNGIKQLVQSNKAGVFHEMERLGRGLVLEIKA